MREDALRTAGRPVTEDAREPRLAAFHVGGRTQRRNRDDKSKHKERNKRNGNRLTEDKRQPGEGLRGGGEGGDGVRHRSMATAQSRGAKRARGEANGPVVTTRGTRWVLGQPGAGGGRGPFTNDVNI